MTAELLAILARLNIVASAAIVLVLMLRPLARRWFGAHQTYALWTLVPLAMTGALAPTPEASGPASLVETVHGRTQTWLSAGTRSDILIGLWALGVLVAVGLVAWRYRRFMQEARAGRAGPAIVGVLAPRLVVPADFAARFTPDERRLVRAHEQAHMDRLDARWNAVALTLAALNWFNPLAHLAVRAMRFDQELACDATVIQQLPAERRRYAETLLRTQEASLTSPLGCGWAGRGLRPLVTRLTTLMQRRPGYGRRDLGKALLLTLCTAAVAAGWASAPPYRQAERSKVTYIDLTPSGVSQVIVLVYPSKRAG